MLCHTHTVFRDQIHFKQQMNTMARGYRDVYWKHQIKKLLYDTHTKI